MIDGNRQPLDSNPERAVFNLIYKFAEDSDKIKIWAKNQPTSTIFGEYIDDVFNVKKSYFDFIIKFKNNTLLARNLNSLLWIVFCNFIRFFFKGRQAASAGQ